jgi:hypothetical protein
LSWIGETPRTAIYKCVGCDHLQTQTVIPQKDVPTESWKKSQVCSECGDLCEYIKILPIKMNVRSMVAIEHNGRRGYISTDGTGKPTYISATKMHYLKTGNVLPQYTSGYEEHLRKNGYADMLQPSTREEIIDQREKNKKISERVTPVTATVSTED